MPNINGYPAKLSFVNIIVGQICLSVNIFGLLMYAKALAMVPMKANASKAPTPSSPFPRTRSHPTAAEKSPT